MNNNVKWISTSQKGKTSKTKMKDDEYFGSGINQYFCIRDKLYFFAKYDEAKCPKCGAKPI